MPHHRQARAAASLLSATGSASASVIAARMLAFSRPSGVLSPWHQSEVRRMASEKLDAASQGLVSASMELSLLPYRLLQLGARPSAWTSAGWMNAWMEAAGLWIGVGNAALRPARAKAVRNRARLSRARGIETGAS